MNTNSTLEDDKHLTSWILDISATDHIIFHLDSFITRKTIKPIPFTLPNGTHIVTSISGSITITPSLIIHVVLYIPTFNVNLILVAKLIDEINFHLSFFANTCHILHNTSKRLIGIANLHKGIYKLEPSRNTSICNSVESNSYDLWRYKLGNLSDIRLKFVSRIFPFITCKSNLAPCNSCHNVKQKRLYFPSSHIHTTLHLLVCYMQIYWVLTLPFLF